MLECFVVAVVAGADDDEFWLGGLAELGWVGGGAAVVGADEQAAGGEEWEELLLTAAFEVAGEADGVTGIVEDGGEAGFVVGRGDVWEVGGVGWRCLG